MKVLVLLLSLLCACAAVRPVIRPMDNVRVRVALDDEQEPYKTYARNCLPGLGALGPTWELVSLSDEPDVNVVYGPIENPDVVGQFVFGTDFVQLDLGKLRNESAFCSVFGHELMHEFIYHRSQHREYADYHICQYPYNQPAPRLCMPGIRTDRAMLSPRLSWQPVDKPTEFDIGALNVCMGP